MPDLKDIENVILPTATLPAGSNVLVVWPSQAVSPSMSVQREIAEQFGTPFEVPYLGIEHLGITIAEEVSAVDVASAYMMRAGGVFPWLIQAPHALDETIELVEDGDELTETIGEQFENLRDAAKVAAALPSILLVGGLVVGGVLVVGGIVYVVSRAKKKVGK